MRLFFWRRRALSDFADAIRPELEAVETPEPSPQLLRRILASRAASVRVILPEPVAQPVSMAKRTIAAIVVAAALLLMSLPLIRITRAGDDIIASSAFFAREAFAQPIERTGRPGLAPVAFSRSSTIRPLSLEVSRRVRSATGELVSESTDSLSVVASGMDGTSAWRVTSRRREVVRSQGRVTSETLYVAQSDLRMLRRSVHVAPYSRFERINIQQQFHGDSVTGRMTTDGPSIGAGRPIARRLRPELAPFLSDAFASIALMAVPISPTWSGSATLLGWAVIDRDVFTAIELRVSGEERITVPAGTFDCWRVSIRIGAQEISYWMRKSDGLGVRVLDEHDAASNGIRETVLMRVKE
jgi:hypothetical protein